MLGAEGVMEGLAPVERLEVGVAVDEGVGVELEEDVVVVEGVLEGVAEGVDVGVLDAEGVVLRDAPSVNVGKDVIDAVGETLAVGIAAPGATQVAPICTTAVFCVAVVSRRTMPEEPVKLRFMASFARGGEIMSALGTGSDGVATVRRRCPEKKSSTLSLSPAFRAMDEKSI